MGDRTEALLRAFAFDVRIWRIQQLDSAAFYAQHGEVVAVKPLLCTGGMQ